MSNKVTVVLLGHKAKAGKDTIAGFVEPLGFRRAAFADKLKHTVMDLYHFNNEQMFGDLKEDPDSRYPNLIDKEYFEPGDADYPNPELNSIAKFDNYLKSSPTLAVDIKSLRIPNPDYVPYFTPRRILQIFGQQQRSINPDIWAAYVFNSTVTRMVEEGYRRIVVTDFRFKNEAKVAERWAQQDQENRVLHTVKVFRPGVLAGSGANDISEIDLDDYEFQHTIINDGTLEELEEKAIRFFKELIITK